MRKGAFLMVEGAIKHLPLTGAKLFGRDAELAWLDACWRDGVFVASIVAWGGVGKTSLVTKWLARMRDDGWRGAERVYDWSFYQQGTNTAGSSDTFFADALAKFGDPNPTAGSPWDKGERLAKLVRVKRTLLVLDGVEPMQYGPGPQEGQFKDPALQTLVKELASNNSGFLLITSRLRLTDVDGMSGAKVQTKALEHLSTEAGAALLLARGAKGTEEELQEASSEYRGHALALTLLGSYLDDVAEGDIRRRNEIGPLVYDERNGGHARRVMTSYESLLGKTELAILRMLGLFDRPATEVEIAALRADPVVPGLTDALVGISRGDWNKALTKLKRIHLIAIETSKAVDAHPLVRQHFSEQLKSDNVDAWREGHRRLYDFLRTNTKKFPETIAEMEPLYKAVVHGCLAEQHQEALVEVYWKRIRRKKNHFSTRKLGAFGYEIEVLAGFFDHPWQQFAAGLSESNKGAVAYGAGCALQAVGRLHDAITPMKLALQTYIHQTNWRDAEISSSALSALYYARGDLREAHAHATKSISFHKKRSAKAPRVSTTATLAAILHAMGQGDEALHYFGEAEKAQIDQYPNFPLLFDTLGALYCALLLDKGDVVGVQERVKRTMGWARDRLSQTPVGVDHLSVGRALLLGIQRGTCGDLDEATAHLQQAVQGLRKAGAQEFIALSLLARAELHIHTREFANARRDLDEAMTIATRCGFRLHEADAHLGYARLALAESNIAEARKHIEKARTMVNETGYHRRDRDLGELEAMTRNQLLDALSNKLNATELDRLATDLGISDAVLPHKYGPHGDRAIAVIKWAEARNRLADVERLYEGLMGLSATPATAPATPAPTIPSGLTPLISTSTVQPPTNMPPIAFTFPPQLVTAYRNGKLAILFGSGLSIADDVQGQFPRWPQLPERFIDQAAHHSALEQKQLDGLRSMFDAKHTSLETMLSGLEMLKTALRDTRKYRAALSAIFRPSDAAAGDAHRALVATCANVLLTTNYDALLESVEGPPTRQVYTWQKAHQALDDINHGRKILFKIHGTAEDEDSVVMTNREYGAAAANETYQQVMSFLLQSYTFLLVGYGINDPLDLDLVFELNTRAFGSAGQTHYALMKDEQSTSTNRDRWQREMNIRTILYTEHNELTGILRALAATKGSTNPP